MKYIYTTSPFENFSILKYRFKTDAPTGKKVSKKENSY